MAEYLAPGVYVEEVSFRSKSIEGVSTTTTGFIGPARYGPVDMVPDVITGLGEFERVYGDGKQLTFGASDLMHNYLWHAVRAFFEEGGKRLYISRVFRPQTDADYAAPPLTASADDAVLTAGKYHDGHGRAWLSARASTTSVGSQTLPTAIFNVADTSLFPTTGEFSLNGNVVAYTGKTSTAFTGCTGGTGTIPTGAVVVSLQIPSTTSVGSQTLTATPFTFNVDNNSAFPATGQFSVNGNLITYTGKTGATSFTGCTGGTAGVTIPTGSSVLGWQPTSTTSVGSQTLTAAAFTFNVADNSAFPPGPNGQFSVNGNLITYAAKAGTTSFTGCTGGIVGNTIPAGSSVLGWQPASTPSVGSQTLPVNTAFNVANNAAFLAPGEFSVNGNVVAYTGKTGTTSLTGCTGGTGTIPAGAVVVYLPPHPANETDRNATILLRARFPGATGNAHVGFFFSLGQNILSQNGGTPVIRGLLDGDLLLVKNGTSEDFFWAESFYDTTTNATSWRFRTNGDTPASAPKAADLTHTDDYVRLVDVTLTVSLADGSGHTDVWDGLPLAPIHQRAGSPDSIFDRFGVAPANLSQSKTLPIVILKGGNFTTALDVLNLFFAFQPGLEDSLKNPSSSNSSRTVDVFLHGGHDGVRPLSDDYKGKADETTATKTGLTAFEDLDDISIVAAPGSSFGYQSPSYGGESATIINLLISHATRMRYRIAVLDSGNNQTISDVRAMRAKMDSTYAALYYPWVRVMDPITRQEIYLPPSGFVTGIYARNDITRAVYKAPANEVVNLALGFEITLNKSQQDVLNPEGINCFRYFPGRGYRLWGARTISSDPEWKYVNLRRYFAYLEHSIDKGTQWAVFEPNGERLWDNVRRTIYDFMLNEWQNGALLGEKPEKAFFVRCDRSTMTQNDLDNGRLVCLIGLAPLRPAEFVIFRIGQWTADHKV